MTCWHTQSFLVYTVTWPVDTLRASKEWGLPWVRWFKCTTRGTQGKSPSPLPKWKCFLEVANLEPMYVWCNKNPTQSHTRNTLMHSKFNFVPYLPLQYSLARCFWISTILLRLVQNACIMHRGFGYAYNCLHKLLMYEIPRVLQSIRVRAASHMCKVK